MKKTVLALTAVLATSLSPLAVVPAASAAACTDPVWSSSRPDAMWSQGKYIVHNNMWNAGGYDVRQRTSACSYRNWRVRVTADNSSGDGAVKTYPNVHRDYHNWSTGHEPRVRAFKTIRSRFGARTPGRGIYNAAYDIWLNGVPGNREIMIWTDNHKQVPYGRRVARGLRFSGRTWKVFASEDNHYIAFVPRRRITHGRIDILARLRWLQRKGMVGRNATLGQICFGFEVVSTGGDPATFKVNRFKVRSVRR
jgi:hypothetical protein